MRRTQMLGVLAVVVFSAVVVAAGAQARVNAIPGSVIKKTAVTKVTLTGWASSPAETAALKTTIRGFERSHPGYKVNYAPINGDYPAAMLAKFAARKPPDVFYVDSNVAPDWMSQGVLEPLDSLIKKNHYNIKAFFPRLVDAFRYKGHIYGLPKDWSPLAMETNNAMMAKAGVKPPKTWAQLTAVAQKLKAADAVPGGAPLCIDPDWARMLAFVYQNKGSFLNKSKTAPTLTSAAVRQAVNYYVGFSKNGLSGTHDKLGVGWCGEALGKEKAAIAFEGNWVVGYMHDTFPDVKYTISPMPKGKVNGNLGFTVSYSIGKNTKNKAAAFKLLSYLTGPKGMRLWTQQGIALPARKDVKIPAGRSAFLKQAGYAHAWQFAPGFSKVIDSANNELQAVFGGKESVDTMLAKVQQAARDALG
ncbi:MAG: ABC transporter substrate-binding protein [Gaiellaceae bacterium]|jgi:multiple sugar transport system substrate-binding protein